MVKSDLHSLTSIYIFWIVHSQIFQPPAQTLSTKPFWRGFHRTQTHGQICMNWTKPCQTNTRRLLRPLVDARQPGAWAQLLGCMMVGGGGGKLITLVAEQFDLLHPRKEWRWQKDGPVHRGGSMHECRRRRAAPYTNWPEQWTRASLPSCHCRGRQQEQQPRTPGEWQLLLCYTTRANPTTHRTFAAVSPGCTLTTSFTQRLTAESSQLFLLFFLFPLCIGFYPTI